MMCFFIYLYAYEFIGLEKKSGKFLSSAKVTKGFKILAETLHMWKI